MSAMVKPIRIERAGACYPVTARGNARREIFPKDRDRRHLCSFLLVPVLALMGCKNPGGMADVPKLPARFENC